MFDEGILPPLISNYPIWIDAYNERIYKDISSCIKTTINSSNNDFIMEKITEPQVLRMERTDKEKQRRKAHGDKGAKFSAAKDWVPRTDGVSNTITTSQKDNMVVEPIQSKVLQVGNLVYGSNFSNPQRGRVYDVNGVSPTMCTYQGGNLQPKILQRARGFNKGGEHTNCSTITSCGWQDNNILQEYFRIRKLTPLEVGRLMDVDDADIRKIQSAGISETQQFKMFGNSIVTNVLFHIFRKMFVETENENQQLTLF